ncbi:MAG: hypothetical protein NZ873_01030 [Crenarchaeota archaeon]|nr:hypothetical protein [Thermoproteota archaeon]MDW8033737.1 hypothetical protein [Nitrososphaerota archaeon]
MTESIISKEVFKCSNCGGPLDYTPETIACVCDYCGTVNWFSTDRFEIFIIPSLTRDEVVNAFWNRMKNDPNMRKVYSNIEIIEIQGSYIPILLGDVSVSGEWVGFRRETEHSGKRIVTRTVTERGSFNTSMRIAFEARRESAEYGLQELISQVKTLVAQPLESVDWKSIGLHVLNAEISPEEAIDELKDMAEDQMRETIRSSKRLDGFYYYSCTPIVNSFWIVLAPLWSIVYKYKGGIYRASISGYNLQLLRISEPVFLSQRILYIIGSIVAILFGAFVLPLTLLAKDNAPSLGVLIFILSCLIGASLSRKSISDVREERWK